MKKDNKGAVAAYLLLAGSLFLLLFLNIAYHDHWLDSDMAAEMIFSKQLAETGHFFATPDWYYSTEFRFLYTHWIMGPLFHFIGSWHVIRMITNLVTYGLMLASYFFFMKPFKVRRSLVVGSSALLLLPFSETMITHMQMGNTYMFHVIIAFLFMGCFARITSCDAVRKQVKPADAAKSQSAGSGKSQAAGNAKPQAISNAKSQPGSGKLPWLIAYLALSIICGVSGVRYLLALQCPLVIAMFIFALRSAEFEGFRKELTASNYKGKCKDFLHSFSLTYFWYAMLGLIAAGVGYGINLFYVCRNYVFQTYEATNFVSVYQGIFLNRVQDAFGSLIMLFGYIPDKGLLSLRGLISMIAFVLILLFGFVAVSSAKAEKGRRGMLVTFFWAAFALNVFIFIFSTSTMVPRYYLTIYVFLLPILCFYLEKEEKLFDRFAVVTILVICMALATGKVVLSFATTDKNADRRQVAQELKNSGIKFGYATYWNANILTELTDGQVEVANVGDAENLEFFRWSSPRKYYDIPYDGPVFLLLTQEEYANAQDAASVKAGEIIYNARGYVILRYDDQSKLLNTK